ncbi:MAG TPA: BON domain-containing protein [Burkholderiales bacterium]
MAFTNGIPIPALALAAGLSILIAGCSDKPAAAPAPRAAPPTATPSTMSLANETDDAAITGRVQTALRADPEIKGIDLKVETWKGEVQLNGIVSNQTQIDQAVAIAQKIEGVTKVGHEMKIRK